MTGEDEDKGVLCEKNARNTQAFRDTNGTPLLSCGLLPSRLSLSTLASHQVCSPMPSMGRGGLAGSVSLSWLTIPPVGNFTLPRSLSMPNIA